MADAFEPATTQCRVSVGVCDVADFCTGSSAWCPADIIAVCQRGALIDAVIELLRVINQGNAEGADWGYSDTYNYFLDNMDAVQKSYTNSLEDGIWVLNDETGAETQEPGIVLESGVTIIGLNGGSQANGALFDENGLDGPNLIGIDRLDVKMIITGDYANYPAGSIVPHWSVSANPDRIEENYALWRELFGDIDYLSLEDLLWLYHDY